MRSAATQQRNRDQRNPSRRCEAEGCSAYTRERKPFCTDHVLDHVYAKRLSAKLDKCESELARVSDQGPMGVDLDGAIVKEILCALFFGGDKTWRRLCKESVFYFNGVSTAVQDAYLRRLRAEGLLTSRRNTRGDSVVSLTPDGVLKSKKVG